MKRLHKILMGGAVALALAVAFAGCKNANDTVGEAAVVDSIAYTASKNSTTNAEATASINYNNPTGDFARGMRLFNNKKKGITTKFVLDVSNSNNPGLLGIVFDLTDNKDGTMNFCVVGVKSNPSKGKAETYVTYFKNVSESNFDKQNFGVSGSNLVYLEPADNSNTELDISPKDGKLNIGVKIEALKKEATSDGDGYDRQDQNNAYKISWFTADETDVTVNLKNGKGDGGFDAIHTCEISRDKIDAKTDKTIEAKMGFYANVYAGQTLKGEWQVADMKHNPNGIFWCDEENVSRTAVTNSNPMGIELVK